MTNRYTYFIGKRVNIIADTEEEAAKLLKMEDYTDSVTETQLLVIGHDITEKGSIYSWSHMTLKEVE